MSTPRKLTTDAPLVMSQADYSEGESSYAGVCPDCGELQWGQFEPDARRRKCEDCGGMRAMGLEWAVVSGLVTLGEGDEG